MVFFVLQRLGKALIGGLVFGAMGDLILEAGGQGIVTRSKSTPMLRISLERLVLRSKNNHQKRG